MIVKAYQGINTWKLWQADFDLEFLGHNCDIRVPGEDHDYWADERFPTGDVDRLIHIDDPAGLREPSAAGHEGKPDVFVRWVKWYTSPETHMIVTNGPVYILNDEGRTIEALH